MRNCTSPVTWPTPERGRFLQTMQERYNHISTELLFFSLEINRIDDAMIEAQLADPAAGRYASWVRDMRAFRPHQLGDELEELLHDKSVTGASAWIAPVRPDVGGDRASRSTATA